MDFYRQSLALHKKLKGKFLTSSSLEVQSKDDLSLVYTPGVAAPCEKIRDDASTVYDYTSKSHTIAVVSDGSAVLGLGNIGAPASIPVMEGKAMLFKQFGEVDAVPITLDTQDTEEIIQTIQRIAPSFGGINLEDISSPRCFEIEKRLDEQLAIPVFHDDQHGTAIVVAAGVINAARFVGKELRTLSVVVNGPGAAGTAITKMLLDLGIDDIVVCDEKGILSVDSCTEDHKLELAKQTNPRKVKGKLADAMQGADVFIGVSVPNILNKSMILSMKDKPILFAMANPEPEISYYEAKQLGVAVMGTGRSDAPNQINNLLAFPGIFKGALEARASSITPKMKTAAAFAIADLVSDQELAAEYIIPDVLNKKIVPAVSQAVREAWRKECE